MKNRIIYTGAFRFPIYDAGALRVLNNAKILRHIGYDVIFYSWGGIHREEDLQNGEYRYQDFRYICTNELSNGKEKRSLIKRFKGHYNRGMKTLNLLSQMPEKIDIVIEYGLNFKFTKKIQKWCKINNIYYINDTTEWYDMSEHFGGKWLPFSWKYELDMRRSYLEIHNKFVISSFMEKYSYNSHNILIPPLVDLKEKKWNKCISIVSDNIKSHNGIRIIFAGSYSKQKDLLLNIINAVISIINLGEQRLQLLVLGVSFVEAEKLLSNNIILENYKKSIVFLGYISSEDVPSYYKISDFSIIIRESSKKNNAGFPTKMAESMAAGCPVILTRTSDLTLYAKDGENAIYIEDISNNSIVSGLRKALSYSNIELLNMKEKAKKIGKTCFDWRNYISKMKNFIEELKK